MALTESDIKIIIAAELKKAGFDKAKKATSSLEKSFKKLGGTIASVFAAQQIVKFGKESVRAFIEDDKAVKRLITTYRNLGMAFEATLVNDYIDQLQRATGVADEQLRPAIEVLTRSTLDYNKAQKLLNTALDVSAGTGYDLQTVSNALSKAYLGNLTSLARLNIGIGQAEAKTLSFDDALARINSRFKGQGAIAAETYAGKINRLNIAANEAKETIGKGLVTSLEILSGDRSIEGLTNQMDDFAKSIANASIGLADLLKPLTTKNPTTGKSIADDLITSYFGPLRDAYQFLERRGEIVTTLLTSAPSRGGAPGAQRLAMENAKLLAKQIADQKKLIAAQKAAQIAAAKKEKETQLLKRAGTVFDMENIQIVAALQGRINEEQRLRLVALLAINNDIADAAEKTTKAILALQAPIFQTLGVTITAGDNATTIIEKLIKAQTQIVLVNTGITSLPKAKNPFEDWDTVMKNIIKNLDDIADKIKKMPSAATTATTSTTTSITTPTSTTSSTTSTIPTITPTITPTATDVFTSSLTNQANVLATARLTANLDSILQSFQATNDLRTLQLEAMQRLYPGRQISDTMTANYQNYRAGERGDVNVTVNVMGSVTAEADLAETIREYLFDYQKTGGDIRTSAVAI